VYSFIEIAQVVHEIYVITRLDPDGLLWPWSVTSRI